MNNENQTNQNLNNNGTLNSTSLGSVSMPNPTPTPTPTPGLNPTPTPMENLNATNPTPTPSTTDNLNNTNLNPGNVNPTNNMASPSPMMDNSPITNNMENLATPDSNSANAPSDQSLGTVPNMSATESNMGPIEQPIPGTMTYSASANSNSNSNGFVEPKKVEKMGTEIPKNTSSKKPMNKILFIVLIVVLLAAIAYGVYYYLSLGKSHSKINVTVNNMEFLINSTLPTDITSYATITGTDPKNCNLVTNTVDVTKEGTYEYSVKCNDQVFKGNITIINNLLPSATPKEVVTSVNSTNEYTAADFIEENSCTMENCTYEFAEDYEFAKLVTATGNREIRIKVKDGGEKENVITSNLIVLAQPIRLYLSCSNDIMTDFIAMGANETSGNGYIFIDYAYRNYIYKIDTLENYNDIVGDKPAEFTYDGITGITTYDDSNLTFTIKNTLTKDMLNSEAEGEFPVNYAEVAAYYANKGYTCKPIVAS